MLHRGAVAVDSTVVRTTGTQTNGAKTFKMILY